jgi:hypothetical protein
MKVERIRDWLEIVGIFGVVLSLIFVGMEMRQTQNIAIANASQSRTEGNVELLLTIATDPVYRTLAMKVDAGNRDQLTVEERWVERQVVTATLYTLENLYHQYLEGFIPPDRWRGTRITLKRLFSSGSSSTVFAQIYDAFPERWSNDFRRLVDEIRAEGS